MKQGESRLRATPLPKAALDSWEALRALVRAESVESFGGVVSRADLVSFEGAPGEVKQRARMILMRRLDVGESARSGILT